MTGPASLPIVIEVRVSDETMPRLVIIGGFPKARINTAGRSPSCVTVATYPGRMSASRAGWPLSLTRVASETANEATLPSRARSSICVALTDWTIPWSFVRSDGADRAAAGTASARTAVTAVRRRR